MAKNGRSMRVTRRNPKRSVATAVAKVEKHSTAAPARFASCTLLGGSRNTSCNREGVIRITTTIIAVSIQVLTTEAAIARRWLRKMVRRGSSRDVTANFAPPAQTSRTKRINILRMLPPFHFIEEA